jgi:hypothetical protein
MSQTPLAPPPSSLHAAHHDGAGEHPTVSWLAAYAVGLAYARDDADDFVASLAELARHDPALLAAARARLARHAVADAATRAKARRLLAAAQHLIDHDPTEMS